MTHFAINRTRRGKGPRTKRAKARRLRRRIILQETQGGR